MDRTLHRKNRIHLRFSFSFTVKLRKANFLRCMFDTQKKMYVDKINLDISFFQVNYSNLMFKHEATNCKRKNVPQKR